METIPEKDWKIVRKLKDRLLVRQCDRILAKVKKIANNKINDSHRSYLELWKTLRSEDKDLSLMFDDVKRSTAMIKILLWKRHGLIKDSEFSEFSAKTKERIKFLISEF